jgi:hypothetical protein
MKQIIISDTSEREINEQLDKLRDEYLVTIVLLSTCPAPEKYSRYDVSITVVVSLEEKLDCLKRGELNTCTD